MALGLITVRGRLANEGHRGCRGSGVGDCAAHRFHPTPFAECRAAGSVAMLPPDRVYGGGREAWPAGIGDHDARAVLRASCHATRGRGRPCRAGHAIGAMAWPHRRAQLRETRSGKVIWISVSGLSGCRPLRPPWPRRAALGTARLSLREVRMSASNCGATADRGEQQVPVARQGRQYPNRLFQQRPIWSAVLQSA